MSTRKLRDCLSKKIPFLLKYTTLLSFLICCNIHQAYPAEKDLHLHKKVTVTPPPVSGRTPDLKSITPQDVLSRVLMVADVLESIRFEMGAEKVEDTEITIRNAQPHDVYFLSRTLLKKIDRLTFVLTGHIGPVLDTQHPDAIRPFHVWQRIEASLKRLLTARHLLGITTPLEEKLAPESTQPSDVFKTILRINRQANLMMTNTLFQGEIYREITLSIHYASALISQFPKSRPTPATIPIEKGKTSDEVYQLLLDLFHQTQAISRQSGLTPLQVIPKEVQSENLAPHVLDDLATGIASELLFLYSKTKNRPQLLISPFLDMKFPSHTFQRAKILEDQLNTLTQLIRETPHWLGAHSR